MCVCVYVCVCERETERERERERVGERKRILECGVQLEIHNPLHQSGHCGAEKECTN
jgi:hypothetical protein